MRFTVLRCNLLIFNSQEIYKGASFIEKILECKWKNHSIHESILDNSSRQNREKLDCEWSGTLSKIKYCCHTQIFFLQASKFIATWHLKEFFGTAGAKQCPFQ